MGQPAAEPIFDGITVVEFGQYIAAPYAAELLAHGGADVISIEPVNGGPTRHNSPLGPVGDGRHYVVKARGKRSLPCDLSTAEGRSIVRALVDDADIMITNMRPGLAERIGLGWETLSESRDDLIYAEVNGFGDEGPLASETCIDIVAQATTGLLRTLGRVEDGRTAASQAMIADFTAGALLAFAIVSALRHRDRTGLGQRVSTSLVAAALTAQHRSANRFDTIDTWHDDLLAQADSPDVASLSRWRDEQFGLAPFFVNTYAVADGEIAVGAVAANGPKLLEVIGIDPSKLEAPARLTGLTVAETVDRVAVAVADREAVELVAALRAVQVPAGRIRFLEEALVDPDLIAAGVIQHFDHPRLGSAYLPAPPVRFSRSAYSPGVDTPQFGAHTDELLRSLGYAAEVIDRLVDDGIVARM